jgi:beta-fructofuranosidase
MLESNAREDLSIGQNECRTDVWTLPSGEIHPDDDARESILRAMAAVDETVPRAAADPTRPVYHFRPPAGYHNDPNGPIWHKGYYHLFYQFHPFTHGAGKGGDIYWGQARSSDLVHWEHLPPAIWPSAERGESVCASGSATINPERRPMVFYTSGDPVERLAGTPEQWAALGDDDLITWRKHPANPILTGELHGSLNITQWRDPFILRDDGQFYLVLGGRVNREEGSGRACLCIYRALDESLTRWEFLNVLYNFPDPDTTSLECPGLFRMGDKWLLFFSHYPPPTQVAYLIGELDKATWMFKPEFQDRLEYSPAGVYAPAATRDPSGRIICWGWVRPAGWYPEGGRGWSGCMTLPRIFELRPDGWLGQTPAPELQALRGEHLSWSDVNLTNEHRVLPDVRGDCLEILAEFERGDTEMCGLLVRRSDDGERGVIIGYDGREMHITGVDPTGVFAGANSLIGADHHVRFEMLPSESTLTLHVFIDKCVLEVYVNGRACYTRALYSPLEDLGVAVFALGARAVAPRIDIWKMKPIW